MYVVFLTSVAMLPCELEMPVPVLKRVDGNKRLRLGINGEGAGPETITQCNDARREEQLMPLSKIRFSQVVCFGYDSPYRNNKYYDINLLEITKGRSRREVPFA